MQANPLDMPGDSSKIPLLVLAGPTAVGKTALAMKLAGLMHSDIISADSAQIYRGMDLGTAKPTAHEQQQVRHHLIDIVEPDQAFSAADYKRAAENTIVKLWNAGQIPFMVGGTGLYIRAVVDNYAFGKKGADPRLRESLAREAENKGLDTLYKRLKDLDPAAAEKIHPNDQRRIIRALEVFILEGRPISEQVTHSGRDLSPYRSLVFSLMMDRDSLYRRIDNRVDFMIKMGFLEEVEKLSSKGFNGNAPGMQVLGYRQLLDYIQGKRTWPATVEEIKKETRNLAKRQLTWFRRMPRVIGIQIEEDPDFSDLAENIYQRVKELLT